MSEVAPRSPSDVLRKQQVMATLSVSCGERSMAGLGKKKREGNEDREMENKRGHWRQIKDTQLND